MYSSAHLAMGLIIGKVTGHYPTAIISSVALDFDHFVPYLEEGKLKSFKGFWRATKDAHDSSRNYLHSFFSWAIISGVIYWFNPEIGAVFSLGMLGHFLLDALDNSDFFPFYPFKKFNVKGTVGYYSKTEFAITILLFIVYLLV